MTTTPNIGLEKPNFNERGWHDEVHANYDKIDAVINAATGLSGVVGVWAVSTAYTTGQRVIDATDNTVWECLVGHTSGTGTFAADRSSNPSYWLQMSAGWTPKGEYGNSTAYAIGDIVSDASDYLYKVCTTAHTSPASGDLRDDTTNWLVIFDGKPANDAASTSATNAATSETNAAASADEVANAIVFKYTFSTSVVEADPGDGIIRFNNATLGSVTEIYVDNVDARSNDLSEVLDELFGSTDTNKGLFFVRQANDGSKWAIYTVQTIADSGGYRKLTVTHVASGTAIDNNAVVALDITKYPSQAVGVLLQANNLSDVSDAGVARANIGAAASVHSHAIGDISGLGALAALATVGTAQIDDDAVTVAKIANNAVTADQIASNAIIAAKIQSNAVVTAKINNGAVTAEKLATDAVETAKIVNDAVTEAKMADNAIGVAQIKHATAGDLLRFNASGAPEYLAKGTDDQVLTLASGVATWADAAGGGWEFVAEEVPTSDVAEISFTGLGGYKAIRVHGIMCTASDDDDSTIDFDISSDGGTNWNSFFQKVHTASGGSTSRGVIGFALDIMDFNRATEHMKILSGVVWGDNANNDFLWYNWNTSDWNTSKCDALFSILGPTTIAADAFRVFFVGENIEGSNANARARVKVWGMA